MRRIPTTFFPILLIALVPGLIVPGGTPARGENPSLLSPERKARAAEILMSPSAAERTRAYEAFRKMGTEAIPLYREMLEAAREAYGYRLDEGLETMQRESRPFMEAFENWERQREETLALLRSELKGDPGKLAELGRLYERTDRHFRHLIRVRRQSTSGLEALSAVTPLREITRELDYCEGDDDPSLPSLRSILKESVYRDEIQEILERLERVETLVKDHESAEIVHKKARWPETRQKKFAEMLNAHRRVFALSALFLEERLSVACLAHSREMSALGYFSHESPTPENASPPLRARRAGYGGSWRGENIFMGDGSPSAAFRAWWNSDGHRFIMFADDANHLGIASASGYWTLNTGQGKGPE